MKLTLKQYQNERLEEYKQTYYWNKTKKLKKELKENIMESKMDKWKNDWYKKVVEHGKNNRLDNKIIYSFDKEYSRQFLLYTFRRNDNALKDWIPSDSI